MARDERAIAVLEDRLTDIKAGDVSRFWRWLEDGIEATKAMEST